ncbi:hypothetical protein TCAL_16551 [Tigriopus californicus]|uniref:Uncharacterized protein n=1 Tax=Tigriopus californicus TaxID=6832 RepID=A0A553NBN4_TIGCA|nr:hypothetical protein TCAL_16551 [Tigriopus californicus]
MAFTDIYLRDEILSSSSRIAGSAGFVFMVALSVTKGSSIKPQGSMAFMRSAIGDEMSRGQI